MNAAPPSDPAPLRAAKQSNVWLRLAGCGLLLAASAVLTGSTLRQLRAAPHASEGVTVAALPAAELEPRRRDVVGTFTTGREPGDRVILVTPDGGIRFYFVGAPEGPLGVRDTFVLAQREKHACLVTRDHGIVDALDIDRLAFSGDVYRRTK